MTPEDREKLIRKIQKCLRLAASSNPHEAAAAMRQAQSMMAAANVSIEALLAADASAAEARATCGTSPAEWECELANTVAEAFGVELLFGHGPVARVRAYTYRRKAGRWVFIGTGAAPDVASYSMTVLLRLIGKARSQYRAKLSKRKATSKTRACDLFCRGWVWQVGKHLEEFAKPVRNERAIAAYLAVNHPDRFEAEGRKSGGRLTARQLDDVANGAIAAEDVRLQHGIGTDAAAAALGQTLALPRAVL